MPANYTEYDVQLSDYRLNAPINDDTGLYMVLQAGIPLAQTCYSDRLGTSLTLPATMTDGRLRFFTASTVTSVDVSIMTAGGRSYFLEGLTPSQHSCSVNTERENYTLVGAWAILSAHADGVVSAVKAPFSGGLPVGLRIKDVYVHKTGAGDGVGAGLVLDLGVSGDPDGFVDGITCSATGYNLINMVTTAKTTAVSDMTVFVATAQVRGALLVNHIAGFDTDSNKAGYGLYSRKPYMISLVTTTNNLVFQITGTSALTTVAGARGYVYYEYDILPTAGN